MTSFTKITVMAAIAVLAFVTAGCGGDSNSEVEYTLASNSVIVDSTLVQSVISIEEDGAVIKLDSSSDLAGKVSDGDILIFQITDKTPNGLLRKVTSKTEVGGQVSLTTTQALLEEAFQDLNLKVNRLLDPASMQSASSSLTGITVQRSSGAGGNDGLDNGEFELNFKDLVVYDEDGNLKTKDDQIVLDGSTRFSLNIIIEIEISWFHLKRLKFGHELGYSNTTIASSHFGKLKFDKNMPLGSFPLPPFMIGPVVITPKLEFVVGVKGDLEAQVSVGLTSGFQQSAGLLYENEKVNSYNEMTSSIQFDPPQLSATGKLKGYAGPKLSALIYGVAGPYIKVNGYLELVADVEKNPWWEFAWGVEGLAGIDGELFGQKLFELKSGDFIGWREVLAKADGPFTICDADCTGLECGSDPICGKNCGTCDSGYTCESGTCMESGDEPDCTGLECGPDPILGESCGTCGIGYTCESGACVEGICEPVCGTAVCGLDPICGESCGTCGEGYKCESGTCVEGICEPVCGTAVCGLDSACGTLSCGTCGIGYTCESGACVEGICEPVCGTAVCGLDPICGESCGTCGTGLTCEDGACKCVPDCTSLECGIDQKCGESCGICIGPSVCQAGKCEWKPGQYTVNCGSDGMCLIPGGLFWMGCNSTVTSGCAVANVHCECVVDSVPFHEVTLSGYYIDKTEVTVAAYGECVTAGSCTVPSTGSSCNWGVSGREQDPMNCVDWTNASIYCAWAGKRLPTEAEWEKAARGTDGRRYPWGVHEPDCAHAVMYECALSTKPVCSKSPIGNSPYGLCDVAGNVSEWVSDWYDEDYYSSSPSNDPTGPQSGVSRSIRGSCLYSVINSNKKYPVLTWVRVWAPAEPFNSGAVGFRCARDAL